MLRRLLFPAVVCCAVLLASGRTAAQTPSEFYDQNCAGCHTIGQGAAAGPDLRGVSQRREREWLIKFLLEPDAFKTDPGVARMIQEAGGLEMPATEGLTREMAIALLEIIEQRSTSASGATGATEVAPYGPYGSPPAVTASDVAAGRDLFTGRARLLAAGPACVQCHDAATLAAPGGGRMGPDLTQVHARLGGARGVTAWLRATPTPVMRAVYRSASLTLDDARLLAAFFEDAAGRAPGPAPSRLRQLAGAALALCAAVLGVIGLTGSGRFRGVRAAMVARATRRPEVSGGSR